jgi:cytoskeletal protein CcmA (bactofilin family)
MWKPANAPTPQQKPNEPAKPTTSTTTTPAAAAAPAPTPVNTMTEPTPVAAPRNANVNTNEQATIGKSLVIKGEVSGSESLYIDGRVEGSINLPGNRVTVGRNGVVNANVNAREIVVIGKLKGNLTATDRVDIRNEGSLTGDVVAQRISIEDGAFFKGGIDIRKPGAANAPKEVGSAEERKEAAKTA